MTEATALHFYASPSQPCSYLPQQVSVSAFADPADPITTLTYSTLIDHGFRRSGQHVYRPHCPSCSDCVAVRIPAARFMPNKNQRRNFKRNEDLTVNILPSGFRAEHFELYKTYMNSRHRDGEMANPEQDDYSRFLMCNWCNTRFIEFRLNKRLVAVAVIDLLPQGFSSVYTFFSPEHNQRSLGRYAILWQINECQRRQLRYVYLGFWIKDCQKMSYKTEYQPLEGLVDERWRRVSR